MPDPKFGNRNLAKFMNVIMTSGKKSIAERIVYGALDQIGKKSGKGPSRDPSSRRWTMSGPWSR
jgi:small subunit ribosomal protein S7